tara:strand:+ start:1165 stop:2109 length:945 start_codon:yes stop_codon:yes gene_type:complete
LWEKYEKNFFFLIIFISTATIYYFFFFSPLKEDKILFVENGKSLKQIANLLEINNIIANRQIFAFYFRLLGKDKSIHSGEYLFKKKINFYKVVKTFKKNDLIYRKITIPECLTVYDITQLLENNPYISGKVLNLPLEGTLFPETYFFLRNESASNLVKRMNLKMSEKLDRVWKDNFKHFNSKNDLLILASLIEAEAKKKNEKYMVSSVFHNRLKKNMRLQSDPTILYEKNLFKKNKNLKIYKKDLQNDNPWNTYTRKGLPHTPICNPGIDALNAAANPYITDFLYFVSDGKGGHRFSSSLEEHKRNIRLWKNNE